MNAILNNYNLLITTSNWFYAPDGKVYRAAWGKAKIYSDVETLGVKTNSHSSNWYAIIGEGEKSITIAGCQIMYACRCDQKPFIGTVEEIRVSDEQASAFKIVRESNIYLAQ